MDKEVVTLTGLSLTILSVTVGFLGWFLKWKLDDLRDVQQRLTDHLIEHARPGIDCQSCPHKKQKQQQSKRPECEPNL